VPGMPVSLDFGMAGHAAYYLLWPAREHPAVDIHGTGNLRERQADPNGA
jgi:hypothetical protein